MIKKPVPAGAEMRLSCIARLSNDSRVIIDWAKSWDFVSYGNHDPKRIYDGVGTFDLDGFTYDIYVDVDNGELWYDADKGWN